MKKESYFLIILIFLFIALNLFQVSSAETNNTSKKISPSYNPSYKTSTLEKEIDVPDYLKIPAKISFGLNETETVNLSILVVLIASWIAIFLFISSTLKILPFFEGWKPFALSAIMTCMVAVSGGIKSLVFGLFSFSQEVKLANNSVIFKLLFTLVIVILLYLGLSFAISKAKNKYKTFEAKEIGLNSATSKIFEE